MALNVETYQHSKKNCGGGSNNGVSQEILDRLDKLENSQNHLYNEFIEDLKTTKYIDEYKTTAVISSNGIIASQFRNDIKEFLDDDSMVDWANSRDLIIENGCAKIAYNSLRNAVLTTNYFTTQNVRGFRFDFIEKHFNVPTASNVLDISSTSSIWFASGVDNSGRLWVVDSQCNTTLNNVKFFVTIYNKDMEIEVPRKDLQVDLVGISAYSSLYLTINGEIAFDEVNNAVIIFAAQYNNMYTPWGNASSNDNYFSMSLISIDRKGDNAKRIITRSFSRGGSSTYLRGNNISQIYKPVFVSNKLIVQWIRNAMHNVYNPDGHDIEWDIASVYEYDMENRTITSVNELSSLDRFSRWPVSSSSWKRQMPSPTVYINDEKNGILREVILGDIYNGNNGPYGIHARTYKYNSGNNEISNATMYAYNHDYASNKSSYGPFGGRLNGIFFSESKSKIYMFRPNNAYESHSVFTINVYDYDVSTGAMTHELSKVIDMKTNATSIFEGMLNTNMKVIEYQGDLHFAFVGRDANDLSNSLKYMCIDGSTLDMKISPTVVHYSNRANGDVYSYNIHSTGNKILFVYNEHGDKAYNPSSVVRRATINLQSTSIQYEYFNENEVRWYAITPGLKVELNTPLNRIRLRSTLISPTVAVSPELHQINLQYWSNENDSVTESEFHSLRIPGIENSGRAVLTADVDNRDGSVNFFVSYDGGITFNEVTLGQEFNYNVIDTPDFRVKIEMAVKNGSDAPPVVRSYNVTSNHVVMHSDLERVQINLIKTNFKIDTLTKAGINGMNKMVIDTLNDTNFIDDSKSDYIHSVATGEISGNYIQTKQMSTNGIIKYMLLTTDEILNSNPNCKIEYFISTDNGKTFDKVTPDVKTRVNSQNAVDDNIVLRAVMYEGAKLTAWGWAWD